MRFPSGAAMVAGVAGQPVRHSLSPLIHSAWIAEAGLDAAYVPLAIHEKGFTRFVHGLRGTSLRGLNVTIPFKEEALALADEADPAAWVAGAANLLLFREDGTVLARNVDGLGMLAALAEQAPAFSAAAEPVAVIGAGGAARGAVAALIDAHCPEVRIVNRTSGRAEALAARFPGRATAYNWDQVAKALDGVGAVINATSLGLDGADDLELPLEAAPPAAVAMDMVYKPLMTGFLKAAKAQGRTVVDGLAMLIGQARPSFEAFYGQPPPAGADVRRLCLEVLGEAP